MKRYYEIESINFDNNNILVIIDKKEHSFSLKKHSKLLFDANEQERNTFEISSSGYGIHWPLIDEDLSIDGLLGVVHQPKFLEKVV